MEFLSARLSAIRDIIEKIEETNKEGVQESRWTHQF